MWWGNDIGDKRYRDTITPIAIMWFFGGKAGQGSKAAVILSASGIEP
jgi:hypothetical protein